MFLGDLASLGSRSLTDQCSLGRPEEVVGEEEVGGRRRPKRHCVESNRADPGLTRNLGLKC